MDMQAKHPDPLLFHLTGRVEPGSAEAGLASAVGRRLCPAALAPYRGLAALRHDFPIVLLKRGRAGVQPLSEMMNHVLAEVAPRGVEGERLRRHALQLEALMRRAVDEGAGGDIAQLWEAAAAGVVAGHTEGSGETLEQVLQHAADALHDGGEVLGCTPQMPARFLTHLWRAAHAEKARRFQSELSRLVIKLSDILRAADSHSQAGRRPESLKAALGGAHRDAFDFEALARIVGKGVPRDELPASRRTRIVQALNVLEAQRFYAFEQHLPGAAEAHDDHRPGDPIGDTFGYVFDDCAAAAAAYRERLPAAAELVRALAVAALEADGRYVEAEHDPLFAAWGPASLTAPDLAQLPDYLVCIPPGRNDAPENAGLLDLLSAGLPAKVLVLTADLLEESAIGTGHFAFGVRSARLATTAMGLGGMFVLQSASANLPALRERVVHGLRTQGPALFSVYVGAPESTGALTPYLGSAAAMQARAFPAFSYDAHAGGHWAARFSLENNAAPEDDWPVETLSWADAAQQRVSEPWAFTYADFALTDPRCAGHFAIVAPEAWTPAMRPVAEWLALPEADAARHVPYVLAAGDDDRLHRVVVDARLMQATRACLLLWHRLQEHGGVHDSHAERLLAKEKAAWAAQQAQAAPAAVPAGSTTQAAGDGAVPPEAPARSRDEAWIDTARCPSCNECQLINDRMFGYDERKQAFIKDLSAGTYRQLVEAAESCQVAIIHPGAPRDPKEPGLEELLARAEPFR